MANFEDSLLLMALVIGPIFMVAGLVTYIFPPKNINSLYGYRTSSSMKSQERWEFAQKYSARWLMILGVAYSLVLYLLSFISMTESTALIFGMGLLILLVIILLILVEKKLKQKFS